MSKVRISIYQPARSITSKNRELKFSTIWIYDGRSPHPSECDVFGDTGLAPGDYLVPVSVGVYQKRPQVNFDFKSAIPFKE